MDLNDLEKHLDKIMNEQNKSSFPDFEGYSPNEMHEILNFTFGTESPVSFREASDADYKTIPMINQVKYFLDLIKGSGEIKLTAKGFLPTRIVKDIYNQGFLEEEFFTTGLYKLYKEQDSITVNLTRILTELAGLTKKRNGKLSLTKKGEKLSSCYKELFELVFKTMATKFNWAYYDGFGDNKIGQLGFGFSIILLHKYGETRRPDIFYAEKYFNAFPNLLDIDSSMFANYPEQSSFRCYSIRTFDRFLDYFGLVEIEKSGLKWNPEKHITRTELFDKLIMVRPDTE